MASLEKDGLNETAAGSDVQGDVNIYEDEINLMDYFLVLWKRKWFILLASVLPVLVVGLVMFLWPRDYKISYIYNTGLGEKAFRVLEDKFYSAENLEKLSQKLKAEGLNEYAGKITGIGTAGGLREFVSFEVSPLYFDAIEPSRAKDMEELEKIQQAKGTLLIMQVKAQSKEHIREIALVCRNNFEQIIPLYSVREELNSKIVGFKGGMASIEEARYTLNQQLERKKTTLEKLKKTGSQSSDKLPSDVTLQFNNVGADSAFLPLAYQVQAAETQIINLQEQIMANKEKYEYDTALLGLNEKLFSHVEKLIPSYYTLGQFRVFLTETLSEYKEDQQQLQDYLNAYIKRVENKIATAMPLVEKPKVYSIAKGTVKKSGIVFVIALMMSVFGAFFLEGLKRSQG